MIWYPLISSNISLEEYSLTTLFKLAVSIVKAKVNKPKEIIAPLGRYLTFTSSLPLTKTLYIETIPKVYIMPNPKNTNTAN
jgi:hypothetical protein